MRIVLANKYISFSTHEDIENVCLQFDYIKPPQLYIEDVIHSQLSINKVYYTHTYM